jgi:serine/threonine-protein phosphatase 5
VDNEILHINRGNHEALAISAIYGFQQELEIKYPGTGIFLEFVELFKSMPLVYVFNNKVMVCHGGLPG